MFGRQPERIGGNLRHRRVGAWPHVTRRTEHVRGAIGIDAHPGGGLAAVGVVARRRDADADQLVSVTHRARRRISP